MINSDISDVTGIKPKPRGHFNAAPINDPSFTSWAKSVCLLSRITGRDEAELIGGEVAQ
jgi:hypothetical protein